MSTKTVGHTPTYYVHDSDDVPSRQFLVEEGKDGNIIEMTPANARLIAASPAMYEALKEAVTFIGEMLLDEAIDLECFPSIEADHQSWMDAIRRAEGKV